MTACLFLREQFIPIGMPARLSGFVFLEFIVAEKDKGVQYRSLNENVSDFGTHDSLQIRSEGFPDDAAAMFEAAKVAQELSTLRVHAYEWRVVVKIADGLRIGSVL